MKVIVMCVDGVLCPIVKRMSRVDTYIYEHSEMVCYVFEVVDVDSQNIRHYIRARFSPRDGKQHNLVLTYFKNEFLFFLNLCTSDEDEQAIFYKLCSLGVWLDNSVFIFVRFVKSIKFYMR
jgi:hypothetical protein